MAKATQNYFRENFYGPETMNIQPSESFPVYGNTILTRLIFDTDTLGIFINMHIC